MKLTELLFRYIKRIDKSKAEDSHKPLMEIEEHTIARSPAQRKNVMELFERG